MAKGIDFEWYMPINRVISDVGVNKNLMLFLAREWYRLYFPFTPFREGTLAELVEFIATDAAAAIYHKVPYANYQYTGDGFNFGRAMHPLASAYWDRAALAAGKGEALVRSAQNYLGKR